MLTTVAITGSTLADRENLGTRVNATPGASFVGRPRVSPSYIVCNDPRSAKAAKFVAGGSRQISEEQLVAFLDAGELPVNEIEREQVKFNLKITWNEWHRPPQAFAMEYRDADGDLYAQTVLVERRGLGSNGHDYIAAYDGERLKTFRCDRIVSLSPLRP